VRVVVPLAVVDAQEAQQQALDTRRAEVDQNLGSGVAQMKAKLAELQNTGTFGTGLGFGSISLQSLDARLTNGNFVALKGDISISPAFDRLTSTDQSRKGGSILAGLAAAVGTDPPRANGAGRRLVCYTDADLSANLAQLGSLAAPVVAGDKVAGALGQRYGIDGAVLVRADGPVTEPHSTGDKPDKIIILFRHFVRALLIPALAQVLDTQAGFKAFDAEALGPAIRQMASFNETFDVELLTRLAQHYGPQALAVEPIVFTEDFAATNFPSVAPGPRHLAMVHQVVELYDRLVAPIAPVTGEAADLLTLIRTLDLDDYVTLIEHLRAEDRDDPTLFDRRWPVQHLRDILHR